MVIPDQANSIHDDDSRYEQVMKRMDKEQFVRQMRQAALLLQSGDGVAAIPILERLRDLYPQDIDVAVNLSGAYILSKRYKDAVPVLESAVEIDPSNAALWSNLAAAHLGVLPISTPAQQEKAIAAYQHVLEINPHYPNTCYNLGLIYEDRGDWEQARAMFYRAMQNNPSDKDARALHAKAERLLNQPELDQNANGTSNPSLN